MMSNSKTIDPKLVGVMNSNKKSMIENVEKNNEQSFIGDGQPKAHEESVC